MVNCFLVKLFNSKDTQTIEFCHPQFSFKLPNQHLVYQCTDCKHEFR